MFFFSINFIFYWQNKVEVRTSVQTLCLITSFISAKVSERSCFFYWIIKEERCFLMFYGFTQTPSLSSACEAALVGRRYAPIADWLFRWHVTFDSSTSVNHTFPPSCTWTHLHKLRSSVICFVFFFLFLIFLFFFEEPNSQRRQSRCRFNYKTTYLPPLLNVHVERKIWPSLLTQSFSILFTMAFFYVSFHSLFFWP